ncbi:hypothetical protein ACQRUO_01880, partial [Kitasatospora sp. LaBMicrA B282]
PERPAEAEPADGVPADGVPADAGSPAAWLIAPASPGPMRPPTAADFPGWDSVVIDFPPDDTESAAERAVPEPRAAVEAAEAEPDQAAGAAQPKRSLLAGRRPSPLLLLSSGVLVGGAVSGVVLVLLAGWGLAYLSAKLGDLTKKFAVFGIPLLTMSVSTFWFWGRTEGRWGSPLAKGAPMTHAAWSAAPGVLRVAGVLSAVFLLLVAMKRRGPKAG